MTDLLIARVEELIARMEKPSSNGPILYTREGAASKLAISPKELDRLRAARKIVARKQGRLVLFHIDELNRYAQALPTDIPE
ncbi:hypothetical protein NJBCHELONAE_48920 [Mycobacteroides chelonae]|uniref:helix-turn-helix domain-containing protein n=1 Tax=Mycobacteroides chelonae TaxID=1774 RepID=UPI0021DD73C0|nr:helix-turn-helix domain-containing protein [Mycobacteroides chelonae]GLE59579.1 hypothetical protein NJBCHELONAE_48920 [Mycobacteroides chelonae]